MGIAKVGFDVLKAVESPVLSNTLREVRPKR
jgi:hypothetical protein